MNAPNPTYTFTSGPAIAGTALALLDTKRSAIEQLPPSLDECYVVCPDPTSGFLLAIADPGDKGQDALASHFQELKLAMDLDQLACLIEAANKVPRSTAGRRWFSRPRRFVFIAIEHGVATAKFVVEARDLSMAMAKADAAYVGCTYNFVGALEQFQAAQRALVDVLQGRARLPALDLRSEWR